MLPMLDLEEPVFVKAKEAEGWVDTEQPEEETCGSEASALQGHLCPTG